VHENWGVFVEHSWALGNVRSSNASCVLLQAMKAMIYEAVEQAPSPDSKIKLQLCY